MNNVDVFDFENTAENGEIDLDEWLKVEATEDDSEQETLADVPAPFDIRQVNIQVQTATIYGLAQRLKRDGIDLYTDFQRKINLWDKGKKSRLIESILLRFPLPNFYFDIENENKWLVVDGLQRLSTLKHFIVDTEDPLKLEGLEILKNLEGCYFKELDVTFRRRILETNVTTFQIQPGTPKQVKYNIFKRINTGGLGLNNMEIRHALNQNGSAKYFFRKLDENPFFQHFVKENYLSTQRMEDRELVLRYVAFSLIDYEKYEPTLTVFLDKAMELLDSVTQEKCDKLLFNLIEAVKCYQDVFGNSRFGRGLTRKARFNSALFEVWTSELAKLSDNDRLLFVQKKKNVKESYPHWLWGDELKKAISVGTSSKKAVITRFSVLKKFIKKMIHD